jgi:hypothetical protein
MLVKLTTGGNKNRGELFATFNTDFFVGPRGVRENLKK